MEVLAQLDALATVVERQRREDRLDVQLEAAATTSSVDNVEDFQVFQLNVYLSSHFVLLIMCNYCIEVSEKKMKKLIMIQKLSTTVNCLTVNVRRNYIWQLTQTETKKNNVKITAICI